MLYKDYLSCWAVNLRSWLTCQPSPILNMHLDPLLLHLGCEQCIVRVMSNNLQTLYVKMHNIFDISSISFMKCTVKFDQITMNQLPQDFTIPIDNFTTECQEYIWTIILVEFGLHLHVHAQCMKIVLVHAFPIVLQSQQVPLPILEQLRTVFFETLVCIIARSTLIQVLCPSCLYLSIPIYLPHPNRQDKHSESDQYCSNYHFFSENESC